MVITLYAVVLLHGIEGSPHAIVWAKCWVGGSGTSVQYIFINIGMNIQLMPRQEFHCRCYLTAGLQLASMIALGMLQNVFTSIAG